MTNTGIANITDNQDQTRLITVSGMTGASGTSPAIALGAANTVSVALVGTFSSATFVINGSNDGGTTWFALKDWQNTAFSFAANGIAFFGPFPLLIQFSWSGGGVGTTVTAYIGLQRTYF